MLTLTGDEIEDLIRRVISYRPPEWVLRDDEIKRLELIGSLFHNAPSLAAQAIRVAGGRIGCSTVRLGWDNAQSMSTESILRATNMFSKAVDVLLTAFVDSETFGAGRRIIEQLGQSSTVPLVNLVDDIYAPQPALALIAALWDGLGGLQGKKIAISWGFGTRHVLPSTAHSLCLMVGSLGADIRVVSPQDFPLLNRVIRETQVRVKSTEAKFEECHDFDSFEDVDAIYALNWCRLDDFNHPERNTRHASKYKEWYFTKDLLSPKSLFVTDSSDPPELLASRELIDSASNVTPELFAWLVRALLGSISYVTHEESI
ncbi:MAG: hypothetical protein ACFFEA_14535, partial [Candidatus Thorarchaeota archaeon]